ncbi:type II secretion system F family protein [Candidatus Omnitrophota bacterium]
MPSFKYRAKDGPEKIVEGQIQAETEREAIEQVSRMGYLPIRVEQQKPAKEKSAKSALKIFSLRISSRDITVFSRQLASFLKSGMPILRALTIIGEQTDNAGLKAMFENIRSQVRDGQTLSSTLAKYPRVFSQLYIAMVRTGEGSGTLHQALLRVAEHRQKQEQIIAQVRMALVYPAVMASVALGTIIFMFTFVMPRLMRIFTSVGEELPTITKVLISISTFLRIGWPGILLALGVIFFIVRKRLRTESGQAAFGRLKLKLPVFGSFATRAELARFSRTLELLLNNGIPILKAIKAVIPTVNNQLIRNELLRSFKELEQGGSLGKSLKQSKLFPGFMTNLLIIGEESGQLEGALSEIADCYERETEEGIKVIATLIEPLIILVMGLVVGFIVIAMLLPVFQINLMVN